MKETKQASGSPEARDAVREVMAAFEAFKGANDARLDEIERKAAADVLLEEKVARIDQAVAAAQARLDRAMSQNRRPAIGGEAAESVSAPEAKAAWDGYLKTGQAVGLETKAGLSSGATSGGYVVPYETERAIERRLMTVSPMGVGPEPFWRLSLKEWRMLVEAPASAAPLARAALERMMEGWPDGG
jgi:HK97 family phage major capsid protein